MPKLEPYSKKLTYSYALGAFPSLALLESRPDRAVRLLLHPDGLENDGVRKLRARCAELGVREEMADRVLRRGVGIFAAGCYSLRRWNDGTLSHAAALSVGIAF